MIDSRDDERDSLDELLARWQPIVPKGLHDRLVAAVGDPVMKRRHYWLLVADSSRVAFKAAVLFLVGSATLAAVALHHGAHARVDSDAITIDQVARVAGLGHADPHDGVDLVADGDGE